MNPLTLGLAAAAITLFIMRGRRRGRGRQLALPADAGFTDDWSTQAAASSDRSPSSTSTSSASSGTSTGRDVQAALRAYCAAYNRLMTAEPDMPWGTSAALSDGVIGSRTRSAWDVVREQINYVYGNTEGNWLTKTAGVQINIRPLSDYSGQPTALREAINFITATANSTGFFQRLASLRG